MNVDNLPKSKFMKIYQSVISWQFLYLALFLIAQILAIAWTDPTSTAKLALALTIVCMAFVIKLMVLIFKHKITLKDYLKMQLEFATVYAIFSVTLAFIIQAQIQIDSFDLYKQSVPNRLALSTLSSVRFFVGTMICSLMMNKKVKKFEFFALFIIILFQTGSLLYKNITLINDLNILITQLEDLHDQVLVEFIQGQIAAEVYTEYSEALTDINLITDSIKDYTLAGIASEIAQLLIMLDLIARPLEKLEEREEIFERFLENVQLNKRKQQIQLHKIRPVSSI